ncbi:low-density lipoprotein receptor-related protein 1B-like isoform X1, partial [Tachysurus ichikawai]
CSSGKIASSCHVCDGYCSNGGTCHLDSETSLPFCQCSVNWTGTQCEKPTNNNSRNDIISGISTRLSLTPNCAVVGCFCRTLQAVNFSTRAHTDERQRRNATVRPRDRRDVYLKRLEGAIHETAT